MHGRPRYKMRMLRDAADWILDRTVVFSFDRSGFRRHARRFRARDLDLDLTGRVCLVTGANAGIGRATATGLAARGADVWLLCRDRARGEEAVAAVRRATGNPRVWLEIVDMAHLESVRACAARLTPTRVHILVHNAGVLPAVRHETPERLEQTLATNVIGPFLLTHLLRPKLAAAGAARVIFVSSGGMYAQRLSLDDLGWRERPFDGVAAYAQTKRMQVILAEMMARRFRRSGIAVHAMHPGWADTAGVRTAIPRFWQIMKNRLRTPEEGADTVIWLATAPREDLGSGRFWFDRAVQAPYMVPFTRETAGERMRLWRTCARLAGLAPGSSGERAGGRNVKHKDERAAGVLQ